MTADLAVWLSAVWDEREEACLSAQAVIDSYSPPTPGSVHELRWMLQIRRDGQFQGGWDMPGPPTPTEDLARIAADRKILALHAIGNDSCDAHDGVTMRSVACDTVRLLAEPHADKPGFRPEWLVERQGVEQVSEPSMKLTAAAAVEALNALTGQDDPESDHGKADTILLATVPNSVREAYIELVKRSKWWASA